MLVGMDGRQMTPFGTAIIIGPHIALTARHVVDEFFQTHEGIDSREKPLGEEAKFSAQVFQFLDGTKVQAWTVNKIFSIDGNDIALLKLIPTNDEQLSYQWRSVRLQLLPPQVGATVYAFGYHSNRLVTTDEAIQIHTNPYTSTGVVQEVHDLGRDRMLLPWPCFRTNARFEKAMSGGPVFTKDGLLCGLICSSYDLETSEADHVSYVSTLWPCMATPVDYDREGYPRGLSYPALELAKDGFISAVDWQSVVSRRDSVGNVGATIVGIR
jgi:hypothetical protein